MPLPFPLLAVQQSRETYALSRKSAPRSETEVRFKLAAVARLDHGLKYRLSAAFNDDLVVVNCAP